MHSIEVLVYFAHADLASIHTVRANKLVGSPCWCVFAEAFFRQLPYRMTDLVYEEQSL
jgi:hypothetical protein